MSVADALRYAREVAAVARRMYGQLPPAAEDLPVKVIAEAVAERADTLGLKWRLVQGTISPVGTGGEMRVTIDGDNVSLPAASMIGRLAVGARVYVILSPPAGVHIVGFLGYDFPPSVSGEAIGRSRMLVQTGAVNDATGTFQIVPGIAFNAVANATYEIRLRVSPAAAVADDYKLDWTVPSGAGMNRYVIMAAGPSTTSAGGYAGNDVLNITAVGMPRYGNSSSAIGGGITAATGSATHWEDIYLKTGANSGTVQLRFARNTASGSTATLRSDGYAIVQRFR